MHVTNEVLWRLDKTSFPAEYWSYPIVEDACVVGSVVTFLDITRRRQLEQQVQNAGKMEALGHLAGGIAHDFNNLLTVINGYSALLLARCADGDAFKKELTRIHSAGDRAAFLTRRLLAFGRRQVLRPRPVNLNDVISGIEPLLRPLLADNIALNLHLSPATREVEADPSQLEQVMLNLAMNARDAMPQGGAMSVETSLATLDESSAVTHPGIPTGEYVLLSVSDSGNGMTAETKARIFEPFFSTREEREGAGLGLSMVYGVVRQSGGYIQVESEPGAGCTFRIYLPVVAPPVAAVTATPSGRATLEPGSETILLVEDDAGVRGFTTRVLTEAGYTVLPARTGEEALELFSNTGLNVDLLVTDLVLPGINGHALAERLVAERPGLRVLYTSGYAEQAIVRRGLADSLDTLLSKPFSPVALASKVRELLDGPGPAGLAVVADDNEDDRTVVRDLLEHLGYRILEAQNGKEVLQLCAQNAVDLVITDLAMPEKEGLETTRELRRDYPNLAIIAISGMTGAPPFLRVASIFGANAVFQKPVDLDKLSTAVKALMPVAK